MSRTSTILRVSAFLLSFALLPNSAGARQPQLPLSSVHRIQSPTKSPFRSVKMVSAVEGYAVASKLLSFDGNGWSVFSSQPPPPFVQILEVRRPHTLWVSSVTYSFESGLYQFTGNGWKEIAHPIANVISCLHEDDRGRLWVGSSGELAVLQEGQWAIHPYPPTIWTLAEILLDVQGTLFVRTVKNELFLWSNGNWHTPVEGSEVEDITVDANGRVFVLAGGKVFVGGRDSLTLHSTSPRMEKASQIAAHDEHAMVAFTATGDLLVFSDRRWTNLPATLPLQPTDIALVSRTEGWLVGENGFILKIGGGDPANPMTASPGFERLEMGEFGKKTEGEYGVGIDDMNNDGLNDIYVVSLYEPNRLLINGGRRLHGPSGGAANVELREEAVLRGATGIVGEFNRTNFTEVYLGVALADFDNDGDLDVYLCNLLGKNKLFLNDGVGYFRNVSAESGRACDRSERTNAAVVADVDGDGDLDLFHVNEESSNRLYLNDGNAYFTEVTDHSGLVTEAGGMGANFSDFDGDGDPDLCLVNWSKKNRLYRNDSSPEHGVLFVDVTEAAGIGGEERAKSNAVVVADIDNDGDLDLFVTNRKTSNRLYRNDGNLRFDDITDGAMGLDSMLSYGASFADLDNDGLVDLYVANVRENVFYRNTGGAKFIRATAAFGLEMGGYSTGTATGDIDGDGDIDLYVASYIDGASALFLNNLDDSASVMLRLEGTVSNRDAVGAKVWLYHASGLPEREHLCAYQEVRSSSGYASFSTRELHFGVDRTLAYDVVVEFPGSGVVRTLQNVHAGERVTVREQDGSERLRTLAMKALRRFFQDPRTRTETGKGMVVLAGVLISMFAARSRYGWRVPVNAGVHISILVLYGVHIASFFHEGPFLVTVLPLSFAYGGLLILHLLYDRAILMRRARAEKEATRDRIARDLHDDIASNLSSARIYLESLKHPPFEGRPFQPDLLGKVNKLLEEASESLTDIVWTVAPQHDLLGDLLVRLRTLVWDVGRAHELQSVIHIDVTQKDLPLTEEVRRNIYLIFKEALTNTIKHASASRVMFSASMEGEVLHLCVEDDGLGFHTGPGFPPGDHEDAGHAPDSLHGHGLRNMEKRADQIGAVWEVTSRPGEGTRITVRLKMT